MISQVKVYCCEDISRIENYEEAVNDTTEMWDCHHRLETHNSDGERRLVDITVKELIALDMYYNRPASELIFLKRDEHTRLHHKGKHWHPSEEHKRRISEALKGRVAPNKGKHLSEETRAKLSEVMKGKPGTFKGKHHSEETRRKMSEARKGRACNHKGTRWFNNGQINKMCFECPEGFVPGRLK